MHIGNHSWDHNHEILPASFSQGVVRGHTGGVHHPAGIPRARLRPVESAYPLLAGGGIMALDDAFNFSTPGVIEGIAEFFLRQKPDLAPLAVAFL